MSITSSFYPENAYGGFTDIDGTVTFFSRINSLLKPEDTVLDVGCGRGEYSEDTVAYRRDLRILRGKAAKVIGIDVDKAAAENPYVDEFHLLDGGGEWPVESNSIDLVVCDFVMEHVEKPEQIFSEFKRVLKPGGYLCVRTPNRWSYVALVAMIIPNKFHARVTSAVQDGRKEEDVFPTLYRCNSTSAIRKQMQKHGFESVVLGHGAEPSYLSFSKLAYFIGVLYQRLMPRALQPTLHAFGRLTS